MKWIVRIIGAVVLIAVVAVVGVLMLPADRIAAIAADQLRKATGRDVTITGDVGLTFWPVLGARVGGLEVGNASWAKDGAMLSTANAAIGVDAAALLGGEIRITNIEAESPTIRLESRADGRASWQFTDATGGAQIETETTPDRAPKAVTIQKLKVTDATLIYDAEGSDLVRYDGVDLTLDWPEAAGAAQIAATLRPAGAPVEVQAQIQQFDTFLAGEVRPVEVRLSNAGGFATVDGRAALEGSVAGQLALDLSSTETFLEQLGLPAAELPKGLGQSVSARAELTLTPDRQLALRGLTADLGGNAVQGDVDVALNGVPEVTANLNAGALDLSGLSGDSQTGSSSGSGSAGSGWSKTPIDASGLAAFNGVIALQASSIDLGSLKFGASRMRLTNERSRMVFGLQDVAAYGGKMTGEFVMNNRNGLSVGGKLNAASVQMKPMLTDLMDLSRFTGTGNARLSFLGVGQSVDAIMRSLKGDGAVNVGRGSIEGIDLDNLLGNFDVEGGTTIFDSFDATYTIAGGILRNDDLAMGLPNFAASGSGQVDLGGQTLDYTIVPKSLRGNGGRGIAVPVRISGPWADPKIRLDAKAAIDLNLAEERKQAEQRVKQQLEEKLQEELNVQEGQSVEDAVKDQIEDKLKKELLRIFD